VDILGALSLVLAQELTQNDRNALFQIVGLFITGAFGTLAAFLGNKGGSKTDRQAEALTKTGELARVKVPAGASEYVNGVSEGVNGSVTQSWRDLAREWQDRYREEAQAHDETKATVAALRAELRRARQQRRERPPDPTGT
jgi:hypothetical protein